MLKYRVLTALILAPLVLLGVFYFNAVGFAIFVGAVIFLAALEWASLMGLSQVGQKAIYAAVVCAVLPLLYSTLLFWTVIVGLVLWCVFILWLILYPRGKALWDSSLLLRAVLGLIMLCAFWASTVIIHNYTPSFIFLLLAVVWATDSGAYFVGKKWGKRKLAPSISPNKSLEGFWGGLILALVVGVCFLPFLSLSPSQNFLFMCIVLITALVSVLGDLVESLFKRLQNVKDSGNLLPGHGGLLDRIDSLLAAAVFLALGLFVLFG